MSASSAPAAGGDSAGTKPTLGLTGLTINAMALIAPGAFLWLTFQIQSLYGAPMAGCAMWFGILAALLLCFATAISYAELSKLYPGAGSSYFFAEQAFLSKTHMRKFARVAKFMVGWASHLYYWVYPGCMVGVTAILSGYLLNQLWPDTFAGNYFSPVFMVLFCVGFAVLVGYIAYRGVTGTTGVNMAINIIQITALLVFAVIAIAYRVDHPEGAQAFQLVNGTPISYVVAQTPVLDDKGNPVKDDQGNIQTTNKIVTKQDLATLPASLGLAAGDPYPEMDKSGKVVPFIASYHLADNDKTFQAHPSAASVVSPHGFSYIIVQACVAILILVGFESVTSMGEEAKNAKRDIPRAVLLSLAIQGIVCYLIEYFAANYFLNSGYTMPNAAASGAPLGDMMTIVGTWLFGSARAGWWFMFIQAITVLLALLGTTLSCLSTGARVTYAMGRDEEVPAHFGMLHGRTLTPHRSIWTLVVISAILGMVTVSLYLGGTSPGPLAPQYAHSLWYAFGIFNSDLMAKLPNTLVVITLISNFGTFLLYMMTCYIAILAFKEHHTFNGFKHMVVPVFGLIANLVCMLFYLVGPFVVNGMSWKEPFIALGICGLWGLYGLVYFLRSSKKKGKSILIVNPVVAKPA